MEETQIIKSKRIFSFEGLKILALAILVCWHSANIKNPDFDAGARMCEFFIIVSGFLVSYNYYGKEIAGGGMKGSIRYFFNKVAKTWPLHIFAMILYFLFRTDYVVSYLNKTPGNGPWIVISSIFLIQSWSNPIKFAFNGVSWFLSALLFCYFLSPLVIKLLKNKKTCIFLFLLAFVIRLFLEFVPYNIFYISIHTSPLIRFLEFFMGMCIAPLFIWAKDKTSKIEENNRKLFSIIFTIIEAIAFTGIILVIVYCDKIFDKRAYFLPSFCLFIFIFAFESGYISKFFGLKPFQIVSKIQLEVYMLQTVGIYCVKMLQPYIFQNVTKGIPMFLIELSAIICLSLFYHFCVSKSAYKGMSFVFDKIGTFLNTGKFRKEPEN